MIFPFDTGDALSRKAAELKRLEQERKQKEKEAKELKDKKGRVSKQRLELVESTLSRLKNAEGAYPQQMMVSQISYLLNMVSGADQEIGKDATVRLLDLGKQFDELKQSIGK